MLKYPLLLRELIRHTPESHPDRAGLDAAVSKIQTVSHASLLIRVSFIFVVKNQVVDEVNRNKQKADNLKQMLALNARISGIPRSITLVLPSRRLVRDGWVQKISGGNDQVCFFCFVSLAYSHVYLGTIRCIVQ